MSPWPPWIDTDDPEAMTRGPGTSPRRIPSLNAKTASLSPPRSATVVNPAIRVFRAKPAPIMALSAASRVTASSRPVGLC